MPPTDNASAPNAAPGARIDLALEHFYATIAALRDVEVHIMPRAQALDEEHFSPAALAAVRMLSADKREQLEAFLTSQSKPDPSELPSATSNGAQNTSVAPSADVPVETTTEAGPSSEAGDGPDAGTTGAGSNDLSAEGQAQDTDADENIPTLQAILDSRWMAVEFSNHLLRTSVAPAREQILRRSLLVTAFGAFETLLAALFTEFFTAHPGALGDETRFSLRDLEAFENIDDARAAAISARVDSLLSLDLTRWSKWFDETVKLKLQDYCVDYAALEEMYQRRHVIVHNNSRASRLYLRRLAGRADLPELADLLPVSSQYFEQALDQLNALGSLAGTRMRAKLGSEEQSAAMTELTTHVYDLMIKGRWLVVQKLCSVGRTVGCDEETKQILTANYWLAEKRLDNFATVADAVRAWDVSALAPRFHLVRLALLDDLDGAFAVAGELLDHRQIDERAIAEWPILAELREDNRYGALIEKHAPTVEDNRD